MKYINFKDLCGLKRTERVRLNPIDSFQTNISNNFHNNLIDPDIAVIKEKNARIDNNSFVKTYDNYLIQDVGYRERTPVGFQNDSLTKIHEPAFLLGGDTNYYHWLINWLPRLFLYESLSLDCKIVVNCNFSKMQLDTLKIIFPWVNETLLIDNQSNFVYQTLYVPNFFLNPVHSPYFLSRLRQRVYSLYYNELKTQKFSDKIYVSRSDAKFRKVVNEQELIHQIEPMGFQKIELGRLSFIDQVNAFFYAKTILAPHGAGLANLMFCNNYPNVVEIINDAYTKVFWSLGWLCGAKKYNVFKGVSIVDANLKMQQYNIFVDIDKLLQEQMDFI